MTTRKTFYRDAILLMLAILYAAATDAASPQEIAKRTFRSTVLLVMNDKNGQPLSLGSGFFIGDGKIATNYHVIAGAASGYAKVVGKKGTFGIQGVIAADPKADLAIIKIKARNIAYLTLRSTDDVSVGDPVYVVGNPQGLEGTFSTGIVSAIRSIGHYKLLQITAPISPGSSGGPVLDTSGRVIGVAAATYKGGQNLNFAIPSDYLKKLASKTGPVTPLTKHHAKNYRHSITSRFGGRGTVGVVGEKFLWQSQLDDGRYSFTLRNKLRSPVTNIRCLVIIYDRDGLPLDVSYVKYRGIIPPGLAKRLTGRLGANIKSLTTPKSRENRFLFARRPSTRVEVRVLQFDVLP